METPKRKKRQVKRRALTATPLKVGSPELGVPTLTVGQIAEQLGPPSPDAAAAMRERIRHGRGKDSCVQSISTTLERAGTAATAPTRCTKRQFLMRSRALVST